MEATLRNNKLNELLNLIETDLDLAKSKLLKSKRLYDTLIEVRVQLGVYIGGDMSDKQKFQLEEIYSKALAVYYKRALGPKREYPVTYQIAKQTLEPMKKYVITLLEEGITFVETPNLIVTSDIVTRALQDAKTLTIKNGASRGLDRLHTAFHGYLKTVCDKENITYLNDPSITQLWKVLRENHPTLKAKSPHDDKIDTIVKSISNVVDAFNQTRNQASPAHPNKTLEEAEAIFVINAVNTLFSYLNTKFK
jgi:hypothetical protein